MNEMLKIRLADPEDAGAIVHNAYIFFTQLAGMYAHAGEFDHDPVVKAKWNELCENLMVDIGALYGIWEGLLADEPQGLRAQERLYHRVTTLCLRAERLVLRLDVWTPRKKWLRMMELLETHWIRVSRLISSHLVTGQDQMAELTANSENRRKSLQDLRSATQEKAKEYEQAYQQLSGKKSA